MAKEVYTVKMRKAVKITVDCKENDRVDVRCGGPLYLGFDFYVNPRYGLEMYKAYIRECFSKHRIPCLSMRCNEVEVKADQQLWTKPALRKAIFKQTELHGKEW